MEIFDLKVTQRHTFGKGSARTLRRDGLVPAILYGPKRDSIALSVSPLDLDKIYKTSGSEQVIFNLMIENGGTQNVTAMVKEVQSAPVTRQYLHIDFYKDFKQFVYITPYQVSVGLVYLPVLVQCVVNSVYEAHSYVSDTVRLHICKVCS